MSCFSKRYDSNIFQICNYWSSISRTVQYIGCGDLSGDSETAHVVALLYVEKDKDVEKVKGAIRSEIIDKPIETLKLAVPAVLYFIQNNVLQLSSSNLPAAVFQVTYQGKTLVVAICSIMLLGKLLSRSKWLALGMMAIGLAMVQLAKSSESKQSEMANNEEQNVFFGLCLVVLGCFCSGFAGVYFEKMMKKPGKNSGQKPSMWVRNIQLAAFSIVVGIIPVLTYDVPNSLFHGFISRLVYGFEQRIRWIVCSCGTFTIVVSSIISLLTRNHTGN